MSMQLFEWWNRVAYLGFRSPVVVHSSPGIGFPLMPAKDTHQLTRYNIHDSQPTAPINKINIKGNIFYSLASTLMHISLT